MTTPSVVSHRSTTTRRTPPEHHRAATEVPRNSGHPPSQASDGQPALWDIKARHADGAGSNLGMISPMVAMTAEQFEELVADALDGIPADLGAAMENVAVVVDSVSPSGRLLGLYEGVPLTKRGAH